MKEILNDKMVTMVGHKPKTLDERIQRLEDIQSIKEVMYQYTRLADLRDPKGMMSCFTNDSITSFIVTDEEGNTEEKLFTKKDTYDYYEKILKQMISGSHHITNEQFFFETTDKVIGYLYMYSWLHFKDSSKKDLHRWGRYEVSYVREEDEEWRIQTLRLLAAGELNGNRIAEQFDRSWPPEILKEENSGKS
ncbi:nuclear transport factor 2 family protein [Salinibacillus xinjiangensis]|uniref:SnoaL-like domain-containing protein n=1 Tax=Salinibacillus xinjiangensis TaxID=1229268 RepID=A0A6G1X1U7_9BACI|nr:nuclear transport factor 2 family protein [Salinibacillus xinjiangensis]MRG84866.1 hypothetical protein [Salinibacillus xinjiangensis]